MFFWKEIHQSPVDFLSKCQKYRALMFIIPPQRSWGEGVYWIHPVRSSVCPSVRCWCPDDNLNSFHRNSIFFWYMYHLGQDLGRDWIWASYLIKYVHNGRSYIFGIPEVNFPARAIKIINVKKPYGDTWYKSRVLLHFNICNFPEFFYKFLNEPRCLLMSVWCPDDNLNCFHRISIFLGICITWVKILDGIEYEHHTSLNMRIVVDHVT